MKNPILKVQDSWNEYKESQEESINFIDEILNVYSGKNVQVIKALTEKLKHMVIYLGQPNSAMEFITRISQHKSFLYGIPYGYERFQYIDSVVKMKKQANFNRNKFRKIEHGHFRWNLRIYKMCREDCDFIKDYFFGIKEEKGALSHINHIDVIKHDECYSINLHTFNKNWFRIVVYNDNTVIANFTDNITDDMKKWSLNYVQKRIKQNKIKVMS